MKIRIGLGIGAAAQLLGEPGGLAAAVGSLDSGGWDSVWFPERAASAQLDPIVAMAYAAARSERLKFGPAVSVVPGRNPVLLAKAMASLDVLSGGRCLPAFGLGIADSAEQQAFGVKRSERAAWFNEAMALMRRLWTEDSVDHRGPRFALHDVGIGPKPLQDPFEVWMGGAAPSELRRIGRLGDGWLASFTTPAQVAAGIGAISEAAAEAGRTLDPEHFGVLIPVSDDPRSDPLVQRVAARRPDIAVAEAVAGSPRALAERIDAFVEAGASKFVVFPLADPGGVAEWMAAIDTLADAVLDKQT